MNSELVLFAGYSIIRQNTSRYWTTKGSYLLRIEKKNVIFSGSKQNLKRILYYLSKICKSLPEYLILPSILSGCLSLSSSRLYSRTRQYPIKKHLILPVCPDFALSRTPEIPWKKHTSEHVFYRTAPSSCFQMSVIFS